MGTKMSIVILAYITWLGTVSAALNSTGPQKFTDTYDDNIAQATQYKEVIMYLTPTQIRNLQQTQQRHGLIIPSPTPQPETPTNNDQRKYFYPITDTSNQQEQPTYVSITNTNRYNTNSDNKEASYGDVFNQRESGIPAAESTYAYRDQNSYVYNRVKTAPVDNQQNKYIAPRAKNANAQQKLYVNPQMQISTTTTEKPKAMQQETLSEGDWQAAFNYLQSDSSKETGQSDKKESYYGSRNYLSNLDTLSSIEQSNYDQKSNTFSNYQQSKLYPITRGQESFPSTESPMRNQDTLLITPDLDHDTQLLFKNKYQLVPYYPEHKNKEEHAQLLQELLNQRIPDRVKATMFSGTQSQNNDKENYKTQYATNYANEGILSEESQKILLQIMTHNMDSHAKLEALSKIRQDYQKLLSEETKNNNQNMMMKSVESKANAEGMMRIPPMKPNEETLSEESQNILRNMLMVNVEERANAESMSKMSRMKQMDGKLSEESKNILQNAMLKNMESQAKVNVISKLPPIIIRKEVKITKQAPLQWINSEPVSPPVWWSASTVPEINVPRAYRLPQDIIKPLGPQTSLVHPEKVDLDKQVFDLEKRFSITEQKPAESSSSFYSETRDLDIGKYENKDSLKKPKKVTIFKHVWTERK